MSRSLCILILAVLPFVLPGAAVGQDFATVIETRSDPLENRVRTVILEKDLSTRSYRIALRPHTRVYDNRAEIVARRSAENFEARHRQSVVTRQALYALHDTLSR